MHIWSRSVVAVGALAAGPCCGYGGADTIDARENGVECEALSCPIALGGDVLIDAYVGTDYTEYTPILSAALDPPELGALTIDGYTITLHASAVGAGILHVVETNDTLIDSPISVVAIASTTVKISSLPDAVDPTGPFDVIGTGALRLFAIHRDANGNRLLGHGLETWTRSAIRRSHAISCRTRPTSV